MGKSYCICIILDRTCVLKKFIISVFISCFYGFFAMKFSIFTFWVFLNYCQEIEKGFICFVYRIRWSVIWFGFFVDMENDFKCKIFTAICVYDFYLWKNGENLILWLVVFRIWILSSSKIQVQCLCLLCCFWLLTTECMFGIMVG